MPTLDMPTTGLDPEQCDALIAALREELEEQGELLSLLSEQQRCILQRDVEGLNAACEAIDRQARVNDQARRRREQCSRAAAEMLGAEGELTLRELTRQFPEAMRPLIESLIDQINHSIDRSRHRLQQNRNVLTRLQSVTSEILQRVHPEGSRTYSAGGQQRAFHAPGTAVQAVG